MEKKRKKSRPLHHALEGLPVRLRDAMIRAGYDVSTKTKRGNYEKTGAQKQFATDARVDNSTVSKILGGEVPPNISAAVILRMADALGVGYGELCGNHTPRKRQPQTSAWAADVDGVITGEEPEAESPASPTREARRGGRSRR